MNYIPINELRRLESKGLIEDLTILSNGEVYCRITSSNVAVLSRLANRSDDFEYHQGEYRIHEDARAINCYYVQFKLPVNTGKFNDVKSVTYHERGMKYIVLEDGTMYYGDSKLTHRKMSEDEFNMLYANAYGPRPNVIGRQFHVCPERDYEYLNGTSIHLHRDELKHLKSEGAYDPKRLRDGTAKFPLLEVGLFFHKSESEFRFVRDDDLAKFVDTLNRVIPWTSFSKDSFRFVRESNIVAGDRRPVWETQTNNGFGVADYIIPYTVSYVPCCGLGRVPVESLSMSERINRLFKCMYDTRGDYIKTIKVLSVARFPGKDPRVRVKYERKLRSTINVYTGSESLPNMHRGGNRVKLPDDYVPGKDGFYKPLFARGVPRHLDSGFEDFIFFKP